MSRVSRLAGVLCLGASSAALPVASVLVASVLVACGGTVDTGSLSQMDMDSPRRRQDGGVDAGAAGAGGGSGALDAGTIGSDAGPYSGKECPVVQPRQGLHECDPFGQPTGCALDQRCVPYVIYPVSCEPEEFGTICAPVGPGVQGDSCDVLDCAAGYLCVTTGQGTQCAHLCRMDHPEDCAPGLLCGPVDVDGYYACF